MTESGRHVSHVRRATGNPGRCLRLGVATGTLEVFEGRYEAAELGQRVNQQAIALVL